MQNANSTGCLELLSGIILGRERDLSELAAHDCLQHFEEVCEIATSHHVILRTFPGLRALAAERIAAQRIDEAIARERARIDIALSALAPICEALHDVGDVIVIKSLDHWPDLGNDLDLFTNGKSGDVVDVMLKQFGARLAERSWGDRLAGKWNFMVPGLPELVEIHIGRLGQTGEQVAITNSLVAGARDARFGPHTFRVPSPEDRVMISTLQRMYRHFYLRLCDIADTARLVESSAIDYLYLRSLAQSAGLWEGVANYLVMVSEYVKRYRGESLSLPSFVTREARFGNERLRFGRKFLRVPIFPVAASFYLSEWKKLLFSGELQNALRLSLLPGLAVAAAVEFKLTGNDKGIW